MNNSGSRISKYTKHHKSQSTTRGSTVFHPYFRVHHHCTLSLHGLLDKPTSELALFSEMRIQIQNHTNIYTRLRLIVLSVLALIELDMELICSTSVHISSLISPAIRHSKRQQGSVKLNPKYSSKNRNRRPVVTRAQKSDSSVQVDKLLGASSNSALEQLDIERGVCVPFRKYSPELVRIVFTEYFLLQISFF